MLRTRKKHCELVLFKHSKVDVQNYYLFLIVSLLKVKLAKKEYDLIYDIVFNNFIDSNKIYYHNEYVKNLSYFKWHLNVKKLVLGPYIKGLDISFFSHCKKLSFVDLSNSSITEIPDYAFIDCIKLKKIIFPKSITKIGKDFCTHTSITEIILPSNIKVLKENFLDYSVLTKVVLPEGLEKIENCFRFSRLRVLNIPFSVTEFTCYNIDKINMRGRILIINAPEHLRETFENIIYDHRRVDIYYY
jgi:hypothetical protein